MGRYKPSGSTGHAITRVAADHYRLTWVVDRYYAGSRQRHPTRYSREADAAGAKRFAKRWGLPTPAPADTEEA